MNNIPALCVLALPAIGCIVHDRDVVDGTYVTNSPPYVWDSAAYLTYDPMAADDIVSFEATVDDPNGLGDVYGVWADVYDDWNGQYIGSVELWPTSDPSFWVADVYNARGGLYLDPFWNDYSVDFVVYDIYEEAGVMTVPLWTY